MGRPCLPSSVMICPRRPPRGVRAGRIRGPHAGGKRRHTMCSSQPNGKPVRITAVLSSAEPCTVGLLLEARLLLLKRVIVGRSTYPTAASVEGPCSPCNFDVKPLLPKLSHAFLRLAPRLH